MSACMKASSVIFHSELNGAVAGVPGVQQRCGAKAGIPMAPTIFAFKGKRSPAKLLKEIKVRICWASLNVGWRIVGECGEHNAMFTTHDCWW